MSRLASSNRKSFLDRKVNEATGKSSGSLATYEMVYDRYEKGFSPGIVFQIGSNNSRKTSGNRYPDSVFYNMERFNSENSGSCQAIIWKFPQEVFNQQNEEKFHWFLKNFGAVQTGDGSLEGNGIHVALSSLSTAFWNFAEDPTESRQDDLISVFSWVSQYFNKLYEYDSYKFQLEALNLLLEKNTSENILKPVSAMAVLHSLNKNIDVHSLLCKIMISVSRTYHDCNKCLGLDEPLGRIFVYYTILDLIEGTPIDIVVKKSREDFITEFNKFNDESLNLNYDEKVIATLTSKIFPDSLEKDLAVVSKIIMKEMKHKKLRGFTFLDIRKELESDITLHGTTYSKPIDIKDTNWEKGGSTNVVDVYKNQIIASFENENHWASISLDLKNFPDNKKIELRGRFIPGNGKGHPGVRVFTSTGNTDWRKRNKEGLTTNGGRGTGFGRPTRLDGVQRLDLSKFEKDEYLGTINVDKSNVDKSNDVIHVKFKTWIRSYPITLKADEKIMIGFKLFKINVKVVDKEDDSMKVSANHQSVSNTSGSFLSDALGKMKV
jgi:hypothetical protein